MLEALIESQAFQGALSVLMVTLLGWIINRVAVARHVADLAILAYKYAEKEGLLQGLAGYDKLSLFMENFVKRYKDQHGGAEPPPTLKAQALKVSEKQIIREDHLGKP